MSQILNKVRDLDPHDVDAAKEALSTFFPNLSKHKEGDCISWLRTLENVINRFPKLCGSQRITIEKYLTYFLDSSSYNSVIEAAKCAHVLQQVRPGQEKAATPKVCWRDLMSALCNAVHSLISELFPNAANIYRSNGEQERETSSDYVLLSTLSEISVVSGQDKILNRQNILFNRLQNVFVFIQAMLVEIYPVAKPVRPQIILDAVIRALGASADSDSAVAAVKQQALRTLDALVACLGPNLIPFSPLVFKCVMQTLRWSSENPDENSSVRSTAYGSLGAWLATLRAHRAPERARAWHDELVAHVTSDVTPARHTVQLTMSSQSRNLSKKQKKKQARVQLQQSSLAAYSPGELNKTTTAESNDQTAIAALDCTEIFLTVCGIFLKPATHKVVHELLVRECFHLEDYSSERGLALLRALEASRRSAPPGVPPPTQYCLQLYSAMINSQHREISKLCSQALLDIRLHLHCSPPSLNFAAEVQTEKKTVEDKKRISRRNREALESLLGADKVPPETNDVEVLLEPDEPANKKPRVDVSDQISLSSASDDPVEICESDSEDIEEIPISAENVNKIVVTADIHDISTDVNDKTADNHEISQIEDTVDKVNIHEATTQMPLHISNDTVDGSESPKSMEVAYGYPNTGTEKVPVLEKLEDENLPSTNDTDDVQITCGQVRRATPDDDRKEMEAIGENEVNEEVKNDEPKVNGVKSPEKVPHEGVTDSGSVFTVTLPSITGVKSPEKVPHKGVTDSGSVLTVTLPSITVKIAADNGEVSVEDMLADFVDEVNDDNVTQA